MICSCGGNRFIAHQLIRADIVVNKRGEFEENLPGGLESNVYDAEMPYGPFTCDNCGKEYDELTD